MTRLRRVEGWEGRLAGFVARAQTRPFQWGTWDCCLMPCDAALEITGADPAAGLRGRYKTARGALRVLKGFAGPDAPDILAGAAEKIAQTLGAPEVDKNFARRGDILLVTGGALEIAPGFDSVLGLCLGREAAVMTAEGMRLIAMDALISRAWAVG